MGSGLKNPCLSVLQHNLVIIRRNAVYNIICSILLRYDVEFKLFDLLIRMVFLKVLAAAKTSFAAISLPLYWKCTAALGSAAFLAAGFFTGAFLATAFTSSAASFTAFFACADTALVLFLVAILSYLPVVCIRPLGHTTGLSPAQTFLCKCSDAIRKL